MSVIPSANLTALNRDIDGWRRGDAQTIHSVQAADCALIGVPGVPPVPRDPDALGDRHRYRLRGAHVDLVDGDRL